MTSEWSLIEQALCRTQVPVPLSRRELLVIREAREGLVEGGSSPWDVLREAVEQMAVKGLTPQEVQLVKSNIAAKGAKVKTGDTGEVMMLDPISWRRIKQELESNPDYYGMIGGGVVDPVVLAQKIGSALSLVMGKGPASQPKSSRGDPAFSGDPSEMTPAIQGPEKFRMDEPKSSRRSSSMLPASFSKSSRAEVSDAYDRMEEDMTAEGIGKWARSAMAAGALGMAGGAMGADQPFAAPASQRAPEITFSSPSVRPEPPPSPKGGKQIDYQKPGWEADQFDTHDPMGGLQPEKKPWHNENAECEAGMEEEGY